MHHMSKLMEVGLHLEENIENVCLCFRYSNKTTICPFWKLLLQYKIKKRILYNCTSSWVKSAGLSSVGLVKLATIAATDTCLLPSGSRHPGCNYTQNIEGSRKFFIAKSMKHSSFCMSKNYLWPQARIRKDTIDAVYFDNFIQCTIYL